MNAYFLMQILPLPLRRKGFALLAAALILLSSMSVSAQFCTDCIDIRTQQTIYRPADQVRILLDVEAELVPLPRVDAYVAAVMPDNRALFIRELLNWEVRDLSSSPIVLESLVNRDVGQYQLYFVLVIPGSDPLDSNKWVAVKAVGLALLPQDWQGSGETVPLVSASGLPLLVTHAGGEINGQIVTNSRQALDNAWEQGQRFFELDFSWTTDRALVLIHDWDQTYRRLFAREDDIPTLAEFEQMPMNFGLEQLGFDGLLSWLELHPGARIITDIKQDNLEGLQWIADRAGESKRQFVPQIYAVDEYDPAVAMGYSNIIFTLYRTDIGDQALLNFVSSHELIAITLPATRAARDGIAQALQDVGTPVYAHTVNFPEFFEFLQTRGVHGIYSDSLLPTVGGGD